MKTNIQIDREPFAETRYYSGTYSDLNEKEYSFTLITELDENSNFLFLTEITWADGTPDDSKDIEKEIKEVWEKEV